jgi:hypothetical protein
MYLSFVMDADVIVMTQRTVIREYLSQVPLGLKAFELRSGESWGRF